MTVLPKIKNLDKILEWTATATILFSICLSSFNIFPWNIYSSFIGNIIWVIVGVMWRKWSVVTMSIVICAILGVGIVHHIFFT